MPYKGLASAKQSPCLPLAAVWWGVMALRSWRQNCQRWMFGCPRQTWRAGLPRWPQPLACQSRLCVFRVAAGCSQPALRMHGSRWARGAGTSVRSAPFLPSGAGSNRLPPRTLPTRPGPCWHRACANSILLHKTLPRGALIWASSTACPACWKSWLALKGLRGCVCSICTPAG